MYRNAETSKLRSSQSTTIAQCVYHGHCPRNIYYVRNKITYLVSYRRRQHHVNRGNMERDRDDALYPKLWSFETTLETSARSRSTLALCCLALPCLPRYLSSQVKFPTSQKPGPGEPRLGPYIPCLVVPVLHSTMVFPAHAVASRIYVLRTQFS